MAYVRDISGEAVSTSVAETGAARIELIRRRFPARVTWRYEQPRPALFWFRAGVRTGHLAAGGRWHDTSYGPGSDLSVIPADCGLEGRLDTGEFTDLVIVFFDEKLLGPAAGPRISEPVMGFGNSVIKRGLMEISARAENPGEFFDLFVAGWAMQTMALIGEMAAHRRTGAGHTGGLSARHVRGTHAYIERHLADPLSVGDLAARCGLSRRHFVRAFTESVGVGPARYVADLRLAAAQRLLAGGTLGIAGVAAACGYAHQQHFANRFKAATGLTPSQFRAAAGR